MKQRLNVLRANYQYLQDTQGLLNKTPDPELSFYGSIFVSEATLNSLLAVADGVTGPIRSIPGASFHIESIRARFSDGLPALAVRAWADKPKDRLRLDLSVSATLEAMVSQHDRSKLLLQVRVTDVVPIAKWTFLQFRLRGFVKNLIQVKVAEYADKLPEISLPLQRQLVFSMPESRRPVTIKTGGGQLQGQLSTPGMDYRESLELSKILFLSDGVHIFFNLKAP